MERWTLRTGRYDLLFSAVMLVLIDSLDADVQQT